ncbi:MAG TPA: class III extradiol ring-cleavage dioxygenase [Acidiferrobacteraceae bacterium]|nr:class III extradiol ring-cleavage dioxygenase [Acidiferrobacteraceae bacterium]
MSSKAATMPTYFLSHGGGPWPWLEGPYREACRLLEDSLRRLPQDLPEPPRAILMVSGHWEEREFAVMGNPQPKMLYDYAGFPEHTYHVQYPAPGAPALAVRIQTLLRSAGLKAHLDADRGFDHGVFAPLAVAFPAADVPVTQLSLRADLDPEVHLAAGRALASLRDEGILIIGSGLSYHNLRLFDPRAAAPSRAFDDWLQTTLLHTAAPARSVRLRAWDSAPSARTAHPRADHLLPLMVAVGAAETDTAALAYHEDAFLGGIAVSSFRFG